MLFRRQTVLRGLPVVLIIACLTGLVAMTGCPKPEPLEDEVEEFVETPDPIKLLVVGDDEIGALISRQWSAQRDGKVEVINQSVEQFANQAGSVDPSIDVLIYPPGFLGELESNGQLQAISKSVWDSEQLNRNEFLRHHRTTLVRHANETWAVPLGAPQWCLVYNAAVLKAIEAELPQTWEEFVELTKVLRATDELKDEEGNPLPTSVSLPLGKSWCGEIFLARVSPNIRSRGRLSTVFDRDSLQPLITQPPFEVALKDLKSLARVDHLDATPESVYRSVLAGEAAIGITWPHPDFAEGMEPTKFPIAIAALPGSDQWYDHHVGKWVRRSLDDPFEVELVGFSGLVASVSQQSRNSRWAFDFLQWLASKPVNLTTVIQSPSSGPFRASHLGDPIRWTGEQLPESAAMQYAELIRRCNDHAVVFMFPRIPGRDRYLAVLDESIRDLLRTDGDVTQTLEQISKQWEEITESNGRNRQRAELRDDVGL